MRDKYFKAMDIQSTIVMALFFVYSAADQSKFVTGSRRATTMENVEAIYNRFMRFSKGKATFYGEYPGGGLCSLDPPSPLARQNDWIKIAVSKEDFQKTLGCGMCVEIRGAGNPSAPDLKGTTPVSGVLKGIVYDLCGSCKQGDVDLYLPGNGEWDITMKAIDCPSLTGTVGYIQLKFTGSNEWYFKLQPRNTKIPVAGVEVFNTVTSDWYCLKRTVDNYFASEGLGKVTFPIKVRLTSITNEKLETTITTLKNDEAFPSDVQFSGIQTRGGSPEGIECFGQGYKSSKDTGPEVDEKFCAGKADGKYADPVDSSAYYECFKGKSYKKYCENGRKFNAMKGECDEAGNVLSNEKREKFSRNRIVKSAEVESMEVRDMSPRSLEEVAKKRRSAIPHKKGHHHHHHHHHHLNGLRSYTHHRHRHWKNKATWKHRRKIHLKATGTRIHQGFKRTPDKKLDVKVKVQFNGPNLSGEFVTKDPTNPKEGKLFVSAVESAEQGDETETQFNRQKFRESGNEKALLLKNNTPQGFNAEVPENPFKFEDDPQSDGGAAKQLNNMEGNVTVQTSVKDKPSLNIEGKTADGQVHASKAAGDLSIPSVRIQHLLKGSYQTKPQVIYLQKGVGSSNDTGNSSAISGNPAGLNVTKLQKVKTNMTSSQVMQPQTIQGIIEAINLVNAIKLTRNSSNIPEGTVNKSMEQKHHRNTTKIINGQNPHGSLMLNNTNSQNGGANLTHSKTKEKLQEPIKAAKEKPKSAPNLKKQDGSFGILFIVNRTMNNNKKEQQQQQQVPSVTGNQVDIIPNIDNKMKTITDKGSEKAGNISAVDKNNEEQSSDLSTPASKVRSEGISKDEQSKHEKVVSKKIHQSVQKAGSVAGLLSLIGDLMKAKVENRSSLLNETVDSSTAMTNGSQDKDCRGKCGKVSIGKINISLQSVSQGESQKNSDEGSNVTYSSTPSGEEQEKSNDLSNQLQVLERPRPMQQGVTPSNSPTNNFGKYNQSELPTSTKLGPVGIQGSQGSIQTMPDSVPFPVMRIRLKKPASKPLGVARMFQDEVLAPASKHRGIFINDDDNEADHKEKPLHTVIIRQYNKDDKHENYDAEDTMPMAGSEDFDEYGNRKMAPPMISMNEADNLLNVDKSLVDNAAIQNVLFNPSLSNSYPEQKERNMKTNEDNSLTGEAEDFANALKNQDDEPNSLQKTAAKQTKSISHRLLHSGDRFGFHGSGVEKNEQHGWVKAQQQVLSNYEGNRLGMEKHKSYMDIDGMGDMPMEGNMDQMQGMDGSMQDMPGMGGGMQGMNGMGGGMRGMNGMGGGMQGMNGMGGGMQGMNGMGGGMRGINGMGGGMRGMNGMGGGAQGMVGMGGGLNAMSGMKGGMQGMSGGMGGTGKGTGPVGMQVLGGSQTEINSNMNQALAGMQDMALKQIQSKYPGMQITMKADDGGEESGEEPTVSVQQATGENHEAAGSASLDPSPSSRPTTSEVFGKHQESKIKNKEKTEGNNNVPNDQPKKIRKESQKTEHHVMNDATSKENDELVSSQSGGNIKATTGDQKQSAKSANQGVEQNDRPSASNNQPTAKLEEPKEICKLRASGVYTNKDDPTKFIICYNGITEERQCADGMIFNPREKVCETTAKQKEDAFQDKPSKAKMKYRKIKSTKSKKPKVSGKKTSSDEE